MKTPRFSISGLMAVVLIVALNMGLAISLYEPPLLKMPLTEVLLAGAFPMGNVLAIALAILIVGRPGPGVRRLGLLGFVGFGAAAWLAFIACSIADDWRVANSVLFFIRASGLKPGLVLVSFVATLYLLPQVGLASVGWLIGRQVGSRSGPNRAASSFDEPTLPIPGRPTTA